MGFLSRNGHAALSYRPVARASLWVGFIFGALVLGAVAEAQAEFRLHVLHINDLHSRLEPINKYDSTCSADADAKGECFGGVARVATKIEELRASLAAAGEHVVTLDAGDQFQGSLMYTTYKGRAAVEIMNTIGFDAMAVGNHEFDDGPPVLSSFIETANFPVISGNIDVSADADLAERIPPYVILDVGGEQVAIVSALATDTNETSSPGPDVVFEDEVAALTRLTKDLTARGITRIVALTHVGVPVDKRIAANVPHLDAVIGGHSHTLFSNDVEGALPYPLMVTGADGRDVPIVQAYAFSKYVGHLTLYFDGDGAVTSATGNTYLLDGSVEPNAQIAARVAELAGPIEAVKQKFVARAASVIDGGRDSCRIGECAMGNLVTDAMLSAVTGQDIDFAIQNGGGLRASIDEGDITMGEVLTVLPFQNTIATFRIDGASIVAALENGVGQVEGGAGRFPQVSGMRFSWSATAPAGNRITSVEIRQADGSFAPLDPKKTYGVVTNNYVRGGGDGYAVFRDAAADVYDFGPSLEDVVAAYLAESGSYQPFTDGRIQQR